MPSPSSVKASFFVPDQNLSWLTLSPLLSLRLSRLLAFFIPMFFANFFFPGLFLWRVSTKPPLLSPHGQRLPPYETSFLSLSLAGKAAVVLPHVPFNDFAKQLFLFSFLFALPSKKHPVLSTSLKVEITLSPPPPPRSSNSVCLPFLFLIHPVPFCDPPPLR